MTEPRGALKGLLKGGVATTGGVWTIVHGLTGTDGIINLDIVTTGNVSLQSTHSFPLIEYFLE